MNDSEYIIKGDTEVITDCLVCVCGTLENAQRCLERMINNPSENDKRLIARHTNLRIEEVAEKDCWWNGNCD
jgi:hypothetical protein